jgi:molybdate transport system substrate-binding protein
VAPEIEIKVISTTAMKMVFEEIASRFERGTGHRLAVELGPSLRLETRLAGGEAADVAIVTSGGIKDLVVGGKIVAGSLVDVARSAIGICVAKGAPKPDISSADAFRRTMLAAKSVALSKPVGGGASGAHMAKVFEQLGIAQAMAAKSHYGAGGATGLAGLVVLRGEAEIGPLPMELQSVTTFTGGIPTGTRHAGAGRALLQFLTTPAVRGVIAATGLEPA